jgi:hypothetical protein
MASIALERLRRDVDYAVARLPGVVGVGVGERDGHVSGEPVGGQPVSGQTVFRVYVTAIFLRSPLARDNIIPLQHDGIPIDVVAHGGVGDVCSSTPDVFPGDQIALETPNQMEAFGTLGLIVTKADGGQTKRFMLTNYHVIEKPIIEDPDHPIVHIDVYKPAKESCNKPVGASRYDVGFGQKSSVFPSPSFPNYPFRVDAALVNINATVKSGNINKNIIKDISQFGPNVRNLLTEFKADFAANPVTTDDPTTMVAQAKALNQAIANKNIKVRKFGAKSKYSNGVIVGACTVDYTKRTVTYELINRSATV